LVVLVWAADLPVDTLVADSARHFARTRADFGHFHHDRRFDHHRRFSGGWDNGLYDYGCSYGYPYYNPYSCYPSAY
jgi:hypothetical protein